MNVFTRFYQQTKTKERLLLIYLPLFLAMVTVACNNTNQLKNSLDVTVSPKIMKANQRVSLQFKIKILHPGGMIPGDKFSFVIPGSWTRPLFAFDTSTKQGTPWIDKELKRMISITSGSTEKWKMDIFSIGKDGTQNRAARTLVFELQKGHIKDGSSITLQFGSNEKPILATFLAETDTIPFRVSWGDGKWYHIASPAVTTLPGPALALRITTPMKAKVGDTVMVHITAKDYYDNATFLPENYHLICSDKKAKILAYNNSKQMKFIRIPVVLHTLGFQTFGVQVESL